MTDRTVTLADVAELELGKSPPQDAIAPLSTGMPLLARPSELGTRTPQPEAATTSPARVARTGDLIVSVRGAKLGVANVADRDYAVGRGAAIVRPLDRSSTDFLYHAISASRPQLERFAGGIAFPAVRLDDLGSLAIPWPDPRAQAHVSNRLELLRRYASHTADYAGRVEPIAEATYALLTASEDAAVPRATVPLGDLAIEISDRISPEEVATERVTHYTHDQVRSRSGPEIIPGSDLRSPRKRIPEGALLLSLIHPARWTTGRAESHHDYLALGSPEFLVLDVPDEDMATHLHAVLRFDARFREQIQALAHASIPGRERTRPKDAVRVGVPLPDPAALRNLSRRYKTVFDLESASRQRAEASAMLLDPARQLLLNASSPTNVARA